MRGYAATLTWANNVVVRLERQALLPMFGDDPIVELGLGSIEEEELLGRLRSDSIYPKMFEAAFPKDSDPHHGRQHHQNRSRRFKGNSQASTHAPTNGSVLKSSLLIPKRVGSRCSLEEQPRAVFRMPLSVSTATAVFCIPQAFNHEGNQFDQSTFANNGLYNLGEDGSYPAGNEGLFDFTGDLADKGKFKPPSLRNIAVTGPYMHDGSIETLEEVIEHYANGGRSIESGPNAGDGTLNPNKSSFVNGFVLTVQEKADLAAFLRTLTDEEFLNNPAFSDPFAE